MSLLDDAVRRRQDDPRGEDADVLRRFLDNRDLAARLAHRYHRSADPGDLLQVAETALLLASRRYQPTLGSFDRFAIVTIIGELKKHLRRAGWNVHVPRRVQEDSFAVQAAIDRLSVELGRSPRVSEVAAAANLTIERVSQALRARSARFAAHEIDLDRWSATPETHDPADVIDLKVALEQLPPDDRALVSLVYDTDLTQREVAARIGISQSQVQRRLARVLRTLHAVLRDLPDGPEPLGA